MLGAELDIRDYKYKQISCNNCKTKGKQKVQAEVDVAIAVKLIDLARLPTVENISLLAGD